MATFVAVTASNGPRILNVDSVLEVLNQYFWSGDVEAVVRIDPIRNEAYLIISGDEWPGAWKIPEGVNADDFEPDYDIDPDDGFQEFLKEVAPFLAEPLTVQAIGYENCRFPLAACEWYVRPGATAVEVTGFGRSADPDETNKPSPSGEPNGSDDPLHVDSQADQG